MDGPRVHKCLRCAVGRGRLECIHAGATGGKPGGAEALLGEGVVYRAGRRWWSGGGRREWREGVDMTGGGRGPEVQGEYGVVGLDQV